MHEYRIIKLNTEKKNKSYRKNSKGVLKKNINLQSDIELD